MANERVSLGELKTQVEEMVNDSSSNLDVLEQKTNELDQRAPAEVGEMAELLRLMDLVEKAREIYRLRREQAAQVTEGLEGDDIFQPFREELERLLNSASILGPVALEKKLNDLVIHYFDIGQRSQEIDQLIMEVRGLAGETQASAPPEQPPQDKYVDVNNWPTNEHPPDARTVGRLATKIATRLAQEPSWNPEGDKGVRELRAFLGDLKDAINSYELPGSSRGNKGQVARFLRRTYVDSAERVLTDVEVRVQRLKNKEFDDWKQKFESSLLKRLLELLNTAAPSSQQDLGQQQQELRSQLSTLQVLLRKTTEALKKQHLEKLIERAKERIVQNSEAIKQNTEREEVVQYRQDIRPFSDAIDNALSVDLANIAPHSNRLDAHTKAGLEIIKTSLEVEYQAASTRNLFDRARYDHNPTIIEAMNYLVGEDNLSGRHAKATEHLAEAIEVAQRLPEKEALENESEELYGQIIASEKPTKGSGSEGEILKKAEKIRENAKKLGTIKEWDIKLKMWDGFITAANADVFNQLAWSDAEASRKRVSGEVNLAEMREFIKAPEIFKAVEKIEEIFLAGPFMYVDERGNPLTNSAGECVGCKKEIVKENFVETAAGRISLNPAIHEIRKGRGGTPQVYNKTSNALIGALFIQETVRNELDASGRPIPLEHDYGRYGNPRDSEREIGKLNIGEVLQAFFPDLRDSTITGIQLMAIIGELRSKAYAPYYASYVESPKPTFDVTPIMQASPMSYILYKVRSFRFIPPKYRTLWQVWRLPTKPSYGSEVLSPHTGERAPDPSQFKYHGNTGTEPYAGVKGNDNVAAAIEVRELVDRRIADGRFRGIELGNDLAIFPYIWDLIMDRDGGKYGGITYTEYMDTMGPWMEIVKLADHPPTLTKEDDLSVAIGQIIGAFSPLKGIYPVLEGSEYYHIFIGTIQEMVLRYVKNIYDQYDEKSKRPTRTLRAMEFRKVTVELFKKAETFPEVLRKYIIDKINDGTGVAGNINDRRIFSDERGFPFRTISVFGKQIRLPSAWWFESRFNNKLKLFLREPSIQEQKQGEGE